MMNSSSSPNSIDPAGLTGYFFGPVGIGASSLTRNTYTV